MHAFRKLSFPDDSFDFQGASDSPNFLSTSITEFPVDIHPNRRFTPSRTRDFVYKLLDFGRKSCPDARARSNWEILTEIILYSIAINGFLRRCRRERRGVEFWDAVRDLAVVAWVYSLRRAANTADARLLLTSLPSLCSSMICFGSPSISCHHH